MSDLLYNSEFPHSDLRINIRQSSTNEIGLLGMISQQVLTYLVSDSSGQKIEYICELGSRQLMTMSDGTEFLGNNEDAINFISKAHTAMISLGYQSIVTDENERVNLRAFDIDLESIALAIAESNHISGI